MRKRRNKYTGEEKVAILRGHLPEAVQVSDVCQEEGLPPTVFDRWQKEFFENSGCHIQAGVARDELCTGGGGGLRVAFLLAGLGHFGPAQPQVLTGEFIGWIH